MLSKKRERHARLVIAYTEREKGFAVASEPVGGDEPARNLIGLGFSFFYSPHDDLAVARVSINSDHLWTYLYRRLLYHYALHSVANVLGEKFDGREKPLKFEGRDDVQHELSTMLKDREAMFAAREVARNRTYGILTNLLQRDFERAIAFGIDDCLLEGELRAVDAKRVAEGLPRLRAGDRKADHLYIADYNATIAAGTPGSGGRVKGDGNKLLFSLPAFERAVLRAVDKHSRDGVRWDNIASFMRNSPSAGALRAATGRHFRDNKDNVKERGYRGSIKIKDLISDVLTITTK